MADEVRPSSIVTRLVIVVFLQWLGATSVLPLLPLYLRQKGATPATTGEVMASYFIGGLVFQFVAGRLSDRYGRKPVLIAALAFYAVACLGFLLPLSPLAYGGMRFVQGAAAGAAEVATLATVSLVVPTAERGRASSRIYAAQLGGAAFGPLLGAFVGIHLMAYVFIFAATAASIAAAPVLRSKLGPNTVRNNEPLPKVTIDARLVGAVCVAASFGLVIGAYESCWTFLMNFKGASSFELGISWTLFALPYVVCFRFGGWFADHTDRRMFATFGILNACAFCAIYPLLSVPGLLALSCFEALGTSLALPSAQSILTEGADPREMGRRQGVFTTAQTGAMAISAMVSGSLFEAGPAVPFVTMAGVAAGVACLIPVIWRRTPGRVARQVAGAGPPQ
ncbi:MAG TPA: MFS transporter [Acidimicrobiales bacterium]|jgi:DHA1 family multidrug resistance protein-like MFS transporter|nr:MFS transporter [Acidimicrobiales bacterium]